MGTRYAIDGFMKCYNWDYVTHAVKINSVPGQIKVHEFDYKGINAVVYDENGHECWGSAAGTMRVSIHSWDVPNYEETGYEN